MALSHFHMHTHSSQFISTAAAKVSHMHQFLYCCLLLTSSEQTAIYRHNLVLKTYKKPSLNTPYYRIINITFCIKVKKKKKKKTNKGFILASVFLYLFSQTHSLQQGAAKGGFLPQAILNSMCVFFNVPKS